MSVFACFLFLIKHQTIHSPIYLKSNNYHLGSLVFYKWVTHATVFLKTNFCLEEKGL